MVWVSAFFSLTFLFAAHATSFYERPFAESVQEAPFIVRGKIGTSAPNWGDLKDGTRQVFTYTNLDVTEAVKGKLAPSRILIRELGGQMGTVGVSVSGTAEFSLGEDVVVFLDPPEKGPEGAPAYPLLGMMMGKYNVEKNEKGEEILQGAGLGSATHPGVRGHEHQVHGEDDPKGRATWTLNQLRQLVEDQARAPEPSPAAPNPPPVALAQDPGSATVAPAPSSSDSAETLDHGPPASPYASLLILTGGLVLAVVLFYTLRRKR